LMWALLQLFRLPHISGIFRSAHGARAFVSIHCIRLSIYLQEKHIAIRVSSSFVDYRYP
jgi:hypothetical protein